MACINGQTYLHRIDRLKNSVWIDGQKITGQLSDHPAFRSIMKSQAELYDMQTDPKLANRLTYDDPESGETTAIAYLEPKTREDLAKKRAAFQLRSRKNAGMMGRAPDYMNTVVMTFAACADLFEEPRCIANMRRYYMSCKKKDLSLTHTFIQPQVNRSPVYIGEDAEIIAAEMIDQNASGIVIHGARLLATQGGMTDEIMVFPTGAFHYNERFAYAFCIPSNTPGLRFICREAFGARKDAFDHPLASRFEEPDTLVVFDHVTVPWDRVFLHGNTDIAGKLYTESGFLPHQVHQASSKNIVKTEFLLGVVQTLTDAIQIGDYQHVQEKISEVIVALETMKALIAASEAQAETDRWGTMTPAREPLMAAMLFFPKVYPRFVEILQLIGASGLISIPTKRDFQSPIGSDLIRYLQASDRDGRERVKLFRLAWDLSMSAFAGRQTLYERFFFGDPVRLSGLLYREYDRKAYVGWVDDFLKNL
jgi:4-hydroxyphenylacetate 3-monooxygenase